MMNPDKKEAFQLEGADNIRHLQAYLGQAMDALSSLDTLCSALELTVEELEAMLEEEEKEEEDKGSIG